MRVSIYVSLLGALVFAACGPSSSASQCVPCGNDACVDTTNNNANCGACGNACTGRDVCLDSQCVADPSQRCTPGATMACYDGAPGTQNVGPCTGGTQTCGSDGYWGGCTGEVVPAPENCSDGIDNDCNGTVDDEHDNDGDGWTNCQGDCCDSTAEGCDKPERVNPGAFDVPGNNLDDDCDGVVDNGITACDSGLSSGSQNAMDYAKAIDLCSVAGANDRKWGVLSAKLVKTDETGAPLSNQESIRTTFGQTPVQLGASMAVLSTGNAAATGQQNPPFADFQSTINGTSAPYPQDFVNAHGGTLPNAPNCPPPDTTNGNVAHDPVMLELTIRVPTNAQSFTLKTNFMSAEFPEYVCTPYNDFFVVLLDSAWNGSPPNPTDKNLAFYVDTGGVKYPVGVNLASLDKGLFQVCKNGAYGCAGSPHPGNITTCGPNTQLTGTGMDNPDIGCTTDINNLDQVGGGTGWLATSGNVNPGETIKVRIALWDTSDGQYDSLALLDGWTWGLDPASPGTVIVN